MKTKDIIGTSCVNQLEGDEFSFVKCFDCGRMHSTKDSSFDTTSGLDGGGNVVDVGTWLCSHCVEKETLQSRISDLEEQVRLGDISLKKSVKDLSDIGESLALAVIIIKMFGGALEFYADDNNYGDGDEDTTSPGGWYVTGSLAGATGSEWVADKGLQAKAALGASEEELKGSLLSELLETKGEDS